MSVRVPARNTIRLVLGPASTRASSAPERCPLCGARGRASKSRSGARRLYTCGAGFERRTDRASWRSVGVCRRGSATRRYAAVVEWLRRRSPAEAQRLSALRGKPRTGAACAVWIWLTHPEATVAERAYCPHCGAATRKLGQPGECWGYAYECFAYWGSSTVCTQPTASAVRIAAARAFAPRRS